MYFFSLRGSAQSAQAYWAAEIPVIPDFISRRSERRQHSASDALRAALAVQRSWLARLHHEDHAATVSLRYLSFNEDGERRLRLGFVGKVEGADENVARQDAAEHWDTFHSVFPDIDYPLLPLTNPEQFSRIFLPFYPRAVAELRRYEEVALLIDAYLPSTLSAASLSDMQPVCQALLAAEEDHLVAINLRPASLTEDERALMAGEVKRLGELKQKSVQRSVQTVGYGVTSQKLETEAELGEETYRKLANNLRLAFELTILVASAGKQSQGIVRSLSAEAVRVDETIEGQKRQHPRAVLTSPANAGERIAAFKNLFDLRFDSWGGALAPAGLERLPRLFSLDEAHTLFRLPVPDDEGVYGLPCSPFGQAIDSGRRKNLRTGAASPGADDIPFGGVNLSRDSLTQHVLISGVPGTGKTNTSLYLLNSLWNKNPSRRVPFLVLEPAKFEYRGFLGTPEVRDQLLIFSAGDERLAPLRFNPFAVPAGISLEAHIGRLLDIFRASMAMWGPLPAILEKLIRQLYRDRGWSYTNVSHDCEPPQMSELYESIGPGVRALNYSRETENEATAALEVRIGRLCDGSFGKMLNARSSIDFDYLMKRPAVIEMATIGNTDDRAFIMALLLNRLYQYWLVRKDQSGQGLKHVTLIEEAHNLLANVTTQQVEGQPNPKGEALQQFANMLAEIRSFGEGLLIADQSPSKLIPDVVKMTGTKITHAVVSDEDREVLKASTNLTNEQRYQLAIMPRGQAVVFHGGSATCAQVTVPSFKDQAAGFSLNVSDAEVRKFTEPFRQAHLDVYLPTAGCVNCPTQCDYDEFTDSAFARLGSQTKENLQRSLRSWTLQAILGNENAGPPYAGFMRALQRVSNGNSDHISERARAFCAMTKLSSDYVREIAHAQFMPHDAHSELHRQFTSALGAAGPEAAGSLRNAFVQIGGRRAPPFEGCEHCALQCLVRGEALRALAGPGAAEIIETFEGESRHKASRIATGAWQIAQLSDVLTGQAEQNLHLAYCIAIQLCEYFDSHANRDEVYQQVLTGKLKFSGCVSCPRRCAFGSEIETIVRQALNDDGSLSLKQVWSSRIGKSQEEVVADLVKVFTEYAAQSPSFAKADLHEQAVLSFCASLHARSLSPVLAEAGARAPDPAAWWGATMAKGFGL